MPNDNYYFYSNLNFIYNYKDDKTFIKECSECQKLCQKLNFNLMKARLAICQIQNFEMSKKTKCLKKIDDISYVLKTLLEKVNKSDDTVKYVYQEAKKLEEYVESKNITDTVYKKSEILYSKLNHTIASINMIKNIFGGTKDKIDSINSELRKPSPNLPQIYELTKEILELTTDYNIAKLQRAQKKFKESKELKNFMYGKKNPKLAHLFSATSSVPMDVDTKPCELPTPFGSVWVKISNTDNSRMIYTHQNCNAKDAPKYDAMCTDLDWYFNPEKNPNYNRTKVIDGIISPIIKYINQPLGKTKNFLGTRDDIRDPKFLFALVKHNYPILNYMDSDHKNSAAFLCGVLLLSESHEFRNPTGGTFERKAMNNVKRLAENGCINPFEVVFGNKKAMYLPAGSMKMNNSKLIIEGKINRDQAKGIVQNLIKLKYRELIDKYGDYLLCQEDKKKLNCYFGRNSANQVVRFSNDVQYKRITKFINNAESYNPPIPVDEIKECLEFLKTLPAAPDNFELKDFPLPIQNMIEKEKKQINKLMNNS